MRPRRESRQAKIVNALSGQLTTRYVPGMAKYFFDTSDNDRFFPDHEGLELPDLAAAQTEAARFLVERAGEVISGSEPCTLSVEVRGNDGPILTTRLIFEVTIVERMVQSAPPLDFDPGRDGEDQDD